MIVFIKRYKAFLLILINIAVGTALPDIALKSLSLTKQNFIENTIRQ